MSPVPSLTGVTSHGLGMFDFPDLQEVPRCRGLMFRSRDTPGLGGGCRLGYGDEQMTGVFDPCSWACDFQVWGSNAILKLLCIYGDPDSRLRAVLAFNTWVVWPSNYIGSLESSSRSYRVGKTRSTRKYVHLALMLRRKATERQLPNRSGPNHTTSLLDATLSSITD